LKRFVGFLGFGLTVTAITLGVSSAPLEAKSFCSTVLAKGGAVWRAFAHSGRQIFDYSKIQGDTVFVIDTSALYSDPELISSLGKAGKNIVIPMSVISRELDAHKTGSGGAVYGDRAVQARGILRDLYSRMHQHAGTAPLREGGLLHILDMADESVLPRAMDADKVDHRIVGLGLELRNKFPEKKVVVVSADIALLTLAGSVSLERMNPRPEEVVAPGTDKPVFVNDIKRVAVPQTTFDYVRDKKSVLLGELEERGIKELDDLPPNSYVVFDVEGAPASDLLLDEVAPPLYRVMKKVGRVPYLVPIFGGKKNGALKELLGNLKPKDFSQLAALDAMLNEREISLVTVSGTVGTGKTFLAAWAAAAQTAGILHGRGEGHKPRFDQIVITRANVPLGGKSREIGHLPGDEKDKMSNLALPFRQNLVAVLKAHRNAAFDVDNGVKSKSDSNDSVEKTVDELFQKSIVLPKALSLIQGTTWARTFIFVDEAQNLSIEEMRSIVGRVGEGSVIVLVGDPRQVNDPLLRGDRNGFAYVRKFHSPLSAHITLTQPVRSALVADFVEFDNRMREQAQ